VNDEIDALKRFSTVMVQPGWGTEFMRRVRVWYGTAFHWLILGARRFQRLQVRLVVKLTPDDVADAHALAERLFPEPAKDLAEQSLRDAATTLLAKETAQGILPDEWLTLASVLRTLRIDYGRDVLGQMVHSALSRKLPKIIPQASSDQPQVQGFLGGAVASVTTPLFAYLSMGLAATLVLTGGWAWVLGARLDHAKNEEAKARDLASQMMTENVEVRERLKDAESRVSEANRSTLETAARAREVVQREIERRARDTAARRAEEQKRAIELKDNPGGVIHDPNEWLRQLAAPASQNGPTPAPGGAGSAAIRPADQLPRSPG
jgi:hypothetical protein